MAEAVIVAVTIVCFRRWSSVFCGVILGKRGVGSYRCALGTSSRRVGLVEVRWSDAYQETVRRQRVHELPFERVE